MYVRIYVRTYFHPGNPICLHSLDQPISSTGCVCCPQCGLASILSSSSYLRTSVQDYTTLKREYRVHFVKVPTGDVVNEMVSA